MYPFFYQEDKDEILKQFPSLNAKYKELQDLIKPLMLTPTLFDQIMKAREEGNPDYTILADAWDKAYKARTPVVIVPDVDGNKKGEKVGEEPSQQVTIVQPPIEDIFRNYKDNHNKDH